METKIKVYQTENFELVKELFEVLPTRFDGMIKDVCATEYRNISPGLQIASPKGYWVYAIVEGAVYYNHGEGWTLEFQNKAEMFCLGYETAFMRK